jgi:hypothetical protein
MPGTLFQRAHRCLGELPSVACVTSHSAIARFTFCHGSIPLVCPAGGRFPYRCRTIRCVLVVVLGGRFTLVQLLRRLC